MIFRKFTSSALVLLLPLSSAIANDREEGVSGTILAPTDRAVTVFDSFDVGLDISKDDPELSVSYGGKLFTVHRDDQSAVAQTVAGSLSLDLPIGGKSDLTDKAVLDGLSNGTKISATISLFNSSFNPNRPYKEPFLSMMKQGVARCIASIEAGDVEGEEKIKNCSEDGSRPARDFAAKYSGYSASTINRALYGGSWLIGAKASVGFADFAWRTPLTLAKNKLSKTQYAGSIFGSYYFADALTSLTGEIEYQNGFEAPDEEIVCKPVVITPADDCVKAVAAPPKAAENLILRIENRRVFWSGFKGGELAIAPQASYDVLNDAFGAELPIYYIPPGDWPVSPGIKVGYSTKDKDVSFGVFLKTAFSF